MIKIAAAGFHRFSDLTSRCWYGVPECPDTPTILVVGDGWLIPVCDAHAVECAATFGKPLEGYVSGLVNGEVIK